MRWKDCLLATALAIVVPCSAGCVVDDSTSPGVPTGSVQLQWSISNQFDPSQCDLHAASRAEIRIYDVDGATVVAQSLPCSDFGATFGLAVGSYTGTVTMTDDGGHPRTTTIDLQPFDVNPGQTTVVDTDFPSDSFY